MICGPPEFVKTLWTLLHALDGDGDELGDELFGLFTTKYPFRGGRRVPFVLEAHLPAPSLGRRSLGVS
jgi:hypothetical protein